VLYEAAGWGVGELLVDGATLLWHDLPHARADSANGDHPLAARLAAYFAGEDVPLEDVDLDLSWCTPFQADVARAIRAVPYGETVTYGELAALAGHPGAHRAAGTFCASNRYPIVLPCHRVVAAAGIGGYGSLGVVYKRRLLALEGIR
jgi:methylated-DNA-[protein]-cysteine S-methyltransferase